MTPLDPDSALAAFALFSVTALKSVLVFVFALAAARLVTRNLPEGRQLVLRLSLIVALLLPMMSVVLPVWELSLSGPLHSDSPFNVIGLVVTAFADGTSNGQTATNYPWFIWILPAWSMGALFVLIRFGYSLSFTWRIVRDSEAVVDEEAVKLFRQITDQFGIRRPPRFASSQAVSVPFAWTLFKPTIVIPWSAQSWRTHDLRMVLWHEMAHVKGHDNWWLVVSSLTAAIYWFNPLLWIVRKKLILESEKACDNHVVNSGAIAADYADFLVGWARRAGTGNAIVPAASEIFGKKQLEVRIMSILKDGVRPARVKGLTAAFVWGLTLLLVLPLAAMQMADEKQAADSRKKAQQIQADSLPAPDSFITFEVAPVAVNLVQPVYPDSAKKAGLEGSVWLKVLIDTKGKVANAIVYKTSGKKMFDDAALDAAKKCQWKPAELSGKPVAVWVAYEVKFKLK